jgi:mannose-6-phosphate isomerase-like protein (cupin superfamily)
MRVTAEGPLSRGGQTNAEGRVTLRAMPPGIYRVRVEGDGFVTLEKEVTLRAATPLSVEFALNAAPAPPPPPPPSPTPPPPPPPPPAAVSDLEPGEPRVLSLLDLTEKSLGGRDPVKTVAVGCSGMSRSQLLVVRDATRPAARQDVDEALYLIAGEATLTLGGRDQPMTPGWFSLVPRGTAYGLVKKGRNPAVLLSVVAGVPCSAPQTTK